MRSQSTFHFLSSLVSPAAALLFLALVVLGHFASIAFAGSSVALNKDNYEELTSGKTVFIKLFSPGCSHCQELAPTWEQMASEWVGHEQGLVGELDCIEHESFCQELYTVTGLPTLLFGEPSMGGAFLVDYADDKTYEALSKFANDTLTVPICTPGNLDPCEKKKRKEYKKMLHMSPSQLQKAIDKKEEAIKAAEKDFKKAFSDMQEKYDKLASEKQLLEASVKSNIRMILSVMSYKEKQSSQY